MQLFAVTFGDLSLAKEAKKEYYKKAREEAKRAGKSELVEGELGDGGGNECILSDRFILYIYFLFLDFRPAFSHCLDLCPIILH